MLVMELMMRDYFRLMVGRNRPDCYIQLWEPKTSRSGRPTSPSDASRRPLSRRGLTRKFVFPPSPETSSEQMRAVSRFSSSARSVLPGDGGVCDVLRYVRRRALSLSGRPRASCGSESQCSKQFERLLWLQITGRVDQEHGGVSRPPSVPSPMWWLWVRLPRRGQGPGAPCGFHAAPMRGAQSLGGSRVGPWRSTKLWARSLCAYKDMRRCPVKHFQDFPRRPKTLGRGGTIHSDKTSFNSALGSPLAARSPQFTAHCTLHTAPVTVCKSGAAREQGSRDRRALALHPE